MHSPTPVRIVIQRRKRGNVEESSFRLIAYTDGHAFRPLEFVSLVALLSFFDKIRPDLRTALHAAASRNGTEIVFSDVVQLSDAEMKQLGLHS